MFTAPRRADSPTPQRSASARLAPRPLIFHPRPRTPEPKENLWDPASILLLALTATLPYLPHFVTEVSGIRLDPASFFLVPALFFVLAARALGTWRWKSGFTDVPHLKWCAVYGLVLSLAYLNGAYDLGYLTDPVRIVYQVYNYGLKELLVYPLLFVLFHDSRKIGVLSSVLIASAVLNAGISIFQGRAGIMPAGLFGLYQKNYLAGTFLFPAFLTLSYIAYSSGIKRTLSIAVLLTFLLAFWYAGSRGAVVAFAVGFACFVAASDRRAQVAGFVAAILIAVVIIKPDFGEASGIRDRFAVVAHGMEEDHLKWRATERWPYFFNEVRQHPWLGVGTDWDPNVDVAMNVPHNGYLSLAVKAGIPALALFLGLVLTLFRWALAMARSSAAEWNRGIGLAVSAAIIAHLVHNLVDSTLDRGVVLYTFWTLFAIIGNLRDLPPKGGSHEAPPSSRLLALAGRSRGSHEEARTRRNGNVSGLPSGVAGSKRLRGFRLQPEGRFTRPPRPSPPRWCPTT